MPNDEHVAVLKRGAATWNAWRGEQKETPELSGAGLRGLDLSGFDLSRVDLRGADLRGTNLSGANLSRAHLERAKQVKAAVRITICGGGRNPRNSLGKKNVNVSPEQFVGSTRPGIPGACAGVVGVCRIVLASDLLAHGIAMDPSDATGSRFILDRFDIVAAGFAAANQHEVSSSSAA
jgi:hypothetical protein